jgi:hypothetical protein
MLKTVELKLEVVPTCTAYDATGPPALDVQLNVNPDTGWFMALSDGEERIGTPGAGITAAAVVKLLAADQPSVLPPAFVAATSQ